jgi:hypothetical protein
MFGTPINPTNDAIFPGWNVEELAAAPADPRADEINGRLQEWVGAAVVVDCCTPFVAIGTLVHATADYLELHDADMHDLRDTSTSRETYVVKVAQHGIGVNRRRLLLRMDQVVGVSPLDAVAKP